MNDWTSKTLGDVCSFKSGTGFPKEYQGHGAGDLLFVKVSDMSLPGNERAFVSANNWVSSDVAGAIKAKAVPLGSTVFAKIGEAVRAERLRRVVGPTAIDNNLMAAVPKPDAVDPDFLYYLLHAVRLSELAQGSALPYLRAGDLAAYPVSLPDLPEQRRIASILDSLDRLLDHNRQLVSNTAVLQQTMFLAVVDGTVPLGQVAQVIMGQSPPGASFNESGNGLVFYQGVRDFGFRFPKVRVWTTAPTRLAEAGDVLVAVRAPVGEVNVATETTGLGRGLAGVRAPGRQATLLQALTADPSIWDIHQGTGTVFSAINKHGMSSLAIPWVSDEALEARLSTLDRAVYELHREIHDLTNTRNELLPLVLSGRVSVRDAEGWVA